MSRPCSCLAALVLALGPSIASSQRSGTARADSLQAVANVRSAIERFAAFYAAGDTAAIAPLLAPRYVHANSNGTVLDRTGWLAWLGARRRAIARGEHTVLSYHNEDVQVDVYGLTALATGVAVARTRDSGGIQTARFRFTNLWVRSSDTWLRAAFHDSRLP